MQTPSVSCHQNGLPINEAPCFSWSLENNLEKAEIQCHSTKAEVEKLFSLKSHTHSAIKTLNLSWVSYLLKRKVKSVI